MPHGTAENEYMHESIEKDAVKFDLDTDQIIAALCYDNDELQTEIAKLKAELEKHRWIPVTERLPVLDGDGTQSPWVHITDGKCVIAAYYYDYTTREAKPNYATGKGWCCSGIRKSTITHWKPIILPE